MPASDDRTRLCLPPIPLPHRARRLRNRLPHPRRGARHDLDTATRRRSGMRERDGRIPRNDVWPCEGDNGEDAIVEDNPADAQGRAAARAYGRHGRFRLSD